MNDLDPLECALCGKIPSWPSGITLPTSVDADDEYFYIHCDCSPDRTTWALTELEAVKKWNEKQRKASQ